MPATIVPLLKGGVGTLQPSSSQWCLVSLGNLTAHKHVRVVCYALLAFHTQLEKKDYSSSDGGYDSHILFKQTERYGLVVPLSRHRSNFGITDHCIIQASHNPDSQNHLAVSISRGPIDASPECLNCGIFSLIAGVSCTMRQ